MEATPGAAGRTLAHTPRCTGGTCPAPTHPLGPLGLAPEPRTDPFTSLKTCPSLPVSCKMKGNYFSPTPRVCSPA